MKRTIFMMLLIVVSGTIAPVAEAQTSVLDQVQAVIDSSVGGLAIGGLSDQRLAQTVTVGIDGQLVGVMLPIVCASGRLIVEIRDVVGGEPGPNVLSRRRFPAQRIPDLGATFQFFQVRGGGLRLMAGDQFAIVLDNPTGQCGIFRGPVGDSYTAGEGFFEALPNPPGWVPFSETETRLDLPFMTMVRVP